MKNFLLIFKYLGVCFVILLIVTIVTPALDQFNVLNLPTKQLNTTIRTLTPTRPSYCAPLPNEAVDYSTLTITPNRFSSQVSYSRPTVTPRKYDLTIDLSAEISIKEKSQIIIFRCNGTFDLYLIGPEINITERIILSPGDLIISSIPPASQMGRKPPKYATADSIITITPMPYPAPVTPTLRKIVPYPIPSTPTPMN